jgi:hypothetical protein
MKARPMFESDRVTHCAARLVEGLLSVAWRALGIVIFASLAILEPLVRVVLSTLATVGLLMTLIVGVLGRAAHFPTVFMFCMSIGCFLLLALYYWILRSFGEL